MRQPLALFAALQAQIPEARHMRIVLGEEESMAGQLVVEFVTGHRVDRCGLDEADLDRPVADLAGEIAVYHHAHKNDPLPRRTVDARPQAVAPSPPCTDERATVSTFLDFLHTNGMAICERSTWDGFDTLMEVRDDPEHMAWMAFYFGDSGRDALFADEDVFARAAAALRMLSAVRRDEGRAPKMLKYVHEHAERMLRALPDIHDLDRYPPLCVGEERYDRPADLAAAVREDAATVEQIDAYASALDLWRKG